MPLNPKDRRELEIRALAIRKNIIRMIEASGAGHLGGALSCADIVSALYFRILRHSPEDPRREDRDRFVLSAGHKCLVLYAALAEAGYFDPAILDTYGTLDSPIPGHPCMHKLPGVEANTGSLGHGLSLSAGMALGLRIAGRNSRVFTVLGDGELAEGSNWEAAAAAGHHGLENLTAIVDRNSLQIGGKTVDIMSYEPLAERWAAFGWSVRTIDGHDLDRIVDVLESAPFEKGKPSVIIADTVKSKGLPFAEGKVSFHYWKAKKEEIEAAKAVLAAAEAALRGAAGSGR